MEKNGVTNVYKASGREVARAFGISLIASLTIVAAVILKFTLLERITGMKPASVAYVLFSLIIAVIFFSYYIYAVCSRSELVKNRRLFAAVNTAIAITVVTNIYAERYSAFLMPCMMAAYIIAVISHGRDAFVANVFTNVLIFFILIVQKNLPGGSVDYYAVISKFAQGLIGGTVVAYWVSNNRRRLHFLLKGLLVGVFSVLAVFAMFAAFGEEPYSPKSIGLLAAGTLGQVVIAFILQPIFESVFNLVTDSRLIELTDHNMPLIKRLKEEAPGTFNHSLAVANFAELCAIAIGENPYLARACAYYHDVGKLVNPQFFKENQSEINPHDGLLPEVSAEIIRGHTTEGKRLCDENRIPPEVSDVTIEHHGTLPVYVFYNKAKQLTDGDVDIADYSYRAKTPVSKSAAIIMLCDSGEAAIRAMDNPDAERVDKLLRTLISQRIAAGQFDDCDITLRDLDVIRQTIISGFGGQFHKRLRYPDGR